jgi:hypothetical protein|tara:strand:- start:77 stop:616 length:540 start_codon:yes stop_codon:yes gene_type:complete
MAITITITKKDAHPIQAKLNLKARKTLDGNIMIFDHDDIDIVAMPKENKVMTFVKQDDSDLAYSTQDRLFKFLVRKGVVLPHTVRAGNIYGSIEAKIPETSDYGNVLYNVLYSIAKFIEKEKPFMTAIQDYDEMEDDRLLAPDRVDSTELGEVPHEDVKGTLRPAYPGYYYGLGGMYRW